MSIVPLHKITICGHQADKESVLEDLQEMGCIHLTPLTERGAEVAQHGPSAEARAALRFLRDCQLQRKQVRDESKFDELTVERRALEIRDKTRDLEDERDFLSHRIENLRNWGDFRFYSTGEMRGQRLWFYQVPIGKMAEVERTSLVWEVVGKDSQYAYVVVIAEKEPLGMPVVRTRTGKKPLSELQSRLEDVQVELEDLQSERASLTKFRDLFARNIKRLEDRQAFFDAFLQTYDADPMFVLQGWAPARRAAEFQEYALKAGVLVELEEPRPAEEPPTLFENSPAASPGEGLVGFYMTPSYWLWDPSGVVVFSFALFFAMILGDAGYALVLSVLLALGWGKLGESPSRRRLRLLFTYLTGASLAWGVIVGSYFGLTPAEGGWLHRLKLLDINNMNTMMNVTIVIGALHIAYANVRDGMRHKTSAGLAPIGWAMIIPACLALYLGVTGVLQQAGYVVIGIGAVLILLFTGAGEKPLKRLLAGLMGFTSVSKAFGDILSYLRLFALGLASSSLAIAFNNLAEQVANSRPGIGILFGLLVLLAGHTMNLGLAIVSGFVHGLRLNLIEFFSWSVKDEGRRFRAFEKSETAR